MELPIVLCIVGPTAVGKTGLSLAAAEATGGEIVSADAMQVYRYMDIGTAKIPAAQRRNIPHHMLDVAEPTSAFTVHEYVASARPIISGIAGAGRLPVGAGGTGLYVRALVDGFDLAGTARDDALRSALQERAKEDGPAALHGQLAQRDPGAAARIHPHDVRRVVRALEIIAHTGQTLAQSYRAEPPWCRPVFVGLTMPRAVLYERIEQRVDQMMEAGLLQEVEDLLRRGCTRQHTSMQAIGYKEIVGHLLGELSLEAAVAEIKRASRRYAKRQLSWYRADPRVMWFETPEDGMMEPLCATVLARLAEEGPALG